MRNGHTMYALNAKITYSECAKLTIKTHDKTLSQRATSGCQVRVEYKKRLALLQAVFYIFSFYSSIGDCTFFKFRYKDTVLLNPHAAQICCIVN